MSDDTCTNYRYDPSLATDPPAGQPPDPPPPRCMGTPGHPGIHMGRTIPHGRLVFWRDGWTEGAEPQDVASAR